MISSVNDHNVFTTDTVDFNTVLLDNECSCSILSNIKLFIPETLVKLDTPILMRGAGGIFEVWFQGQTKSFGPALFSETVPCQILSFYTVTKKYRVEWLQSEQTMRVHMSEHDHLDFMATEASKMYLHKFSDKFIQQLSNRIADPSFPCCTDSLPETEHDIDTSFKADEEFVTAIYSKDNGSVETVTQNLLNHSKQEVQHANDAIQLQRKLAFASDRDIHDTISHGVITNLTVTTSYFQLGRHIYVVHL